MEKGNPASRRRLETRILHFEQLDGNEDVGDQVWHGYTYVWNEAQTDAVLIDGEGLDRELTIRDPSAPGGVRKQMWRFPSRSECTLCHTMPAKFAPLGGVGVIADSTWAAIKGREALNVTWNDGPNASYDSDTYKAKMQATAHKPGKVERNEGDVDKALAGAAKVIERDYYIPHGVHVPMEPPAATVQIKDGKAEVWACVQSPAISNRVRYFSMVVSSETRRPRWLSDAPCPGTCGASENTTGGSSSSNFA